MSPRISPFFLVAGVIALDQATKILLRRALPYEQTVAIIPGFFNLVHAENPGVAFSMFANAAGPLRLIALLSISSIAVLFIAYLLASGAVAHDRVFRSALALILGGAAGNLIDRVRFQTVTDFIEVYAGNHYFPAFNAADSAITIGAALLVIGMWRTRPGAVKSTHHAS